MATGDQGDISSRLRKFLPSWFPITGQSDVGSATPVLDAVLAGSASALATVYQTQAYVRLQTRIATATEVSLDLIALDYLGPSFTRNPSETDNAFRKRISLQLMAPRGTRASVILAIQNLTGTTPKIFEPYNAQDTGGYDTGGLGYDVAGGYGSRDLPYQYFIKVNLSGVGVGVPNSGGYDTVGGYDAGWLQYVDQDMISGTVTAADIYAAVAASTPVGTIGWVAINQP